MIVDANAIGSRIKRSRKLKGLTQEQLAEQIGYSKNYLSTVERGKSIPTIEFLFKLCTALRETPDYFLIGKRNENSDRILDLINSLPYDDQELVLFLISQIVEYRRKIDN